MTLITSSKANNKSYSYASAVVFDRIRSHCMIQYSYQKVMSTASTMSTVDTKLHCCLRGIHRRSLCVGFMLGHRLRRWPSMKPAQSERLLFPGNSITYRVRQGRNYFTASSHSHNIQSTDPQARYKRDGPVFYDIFSVNGMRSSCSLLDWMIQLFVAEQDTPIIYASRKYNGSQSLKWLAWSCKTR